MLYAVNANRETLSPTLNNRGLDTHDMVEASDDVESRGVCIEGRVGIVRPTKKRYRRLSGALRRFASGRRCIFGQELEKVVGHATFARLVRLCAVS